MNLNHRNLELKSVINASGKMTILGVSKVSDRVVDAQCYGGQTFFEMDQLMIKTGKYLAEKLETEDAQIVSSASAAIAQSIAGIIGKGSIFHLYHPYSETIDEREIIIPKGHNVDYGTPVELMVQQGGGKVVEAGYANVCTKDHLVQMINKQTAGILYIKSHHTVQKSMITVKEAAKVAKEYNLPLIVDAAAEEDLFKYTNEGADLVIYSGAKAFEGPSSGLVIGKKKYIEWVRMQGKGIGRSMKIGKENIIGLVEAIEIFLNEGKESGKSMIKRLTLFVEKLNQLSGIKAEIVQDSAGRDIYRAKVFFSGKKRAKEVVEELKNNDPAIYTREYQVNNDIIEFDIRSVTERELELIYEQIESCLRKCE